MTVLSLVGSLLAGLGLFDAVLYTFAAVSTGGFAPHDGSLTTFSWPAQAWITLLCLAGAIPLTLYHREFWQKRRVAVDVLQLLAVVPAVALVTLLLAASMWVREDSRGYEFFIRHRCWPFPRKAPQVFPHAPAAALGVGYSLGPFQRSWSTCSRRDYGGAPVWLPWGSIHMGATPGHHRAHTVASPGPPGRDGVSNRQTS